MPLPLLNDALLWPIQKITFSTIHWNKGHNYTNDKVFKKTI